MTLRARAAQSMRVTLLATIVSGAVQALVLVVLARLLHPAQYGVVAAALVVVKPAQQILFNGVEQAAVLQTDLDPRATTSLFWLAAAAAVVGVLAIAAGASLLPILPDVQNAIIGLSFILVGPALALAPRVVLRRELAFGKLAVAETAATVVGLGAVSVASALAGFGSLSLVFGYVAQTLVRAAACYAFCPDSVRGGGFDLAAALPSLSMAARITKVSVLEIVHAQIAPGFVGVYLGAAPLGQFSQAVSLLALPGQMIAMSMTRVASTSFRIVREQRIQLRDTCRSLVETASAITLPICFGIAAASGPLVGVVMGPQWTEAGRIMPWLAIGAACGVLGHLLAVMNEAAGRLEEKFRIQLVTSIVLVIAMLFAARLGLRVCSQAYSVTAFVYLIAQAVLAGRTLGARAADMVGWIAPGCVCSVLIYGAVTGIQTLGAALPPSVQLASDVICSAAILLGLYSAFFPRLQRELLELAGLREAAAAELEAVG